MAGRLQKVVAALAAVWASAGMAGAHASTGIEDLVASGPPAPWVSFVADRTALDRAAPGADDAVFASAGATVRDRRSGWSASLFVGSLERARAANDEALRIRTSSSVAAQVSRRLSKTVRVSFDVFNVFDQRVSEVDYFSASRLFSQPGTPENFLVNPAEPRGFRLRIRKTF